MNSVNLIGRLTRDPELRETEGKFTVCNFTIAVNDYRAKEERADFLRIVTFGKQAENCKKYLGKGRYAGVAGRLKADTYEDKNGIKRYPIEIIADRVQFIDWPKKESETAEAV
jgi:single-strand DNA-binding protein